MSISKAFRSMGFPAGESDAWAPMRTPIHPPTRAAYEAATFMLLHHTGIVQRELDNLWDVDPADGDFGDESPAVF